VCRPWHRWQVMPIPRSSSVGGSSHDSAKEPCMTQALERGGNCVSTRVPCWSACSIVQRPAGPTATAAEALCTDAQASRAACSCHSCHGAGDLEWYHACIPRRSFSGYPEPICACCGLSQLTRSARHLRFQRLAALQWRMHTAHHCRSWCTRLQQAGTLSPRRSPKYPEVLR
jgi:hypothetical protein